MKHLEETIINYDKKVMKLEQEIEKLKFIINEKDRVINELLSRIADLEYEVEKCMNS